MRTAGAAIISVVFFFVLYLGIHFAALVSAVLAVGMYAGIYFLLKPSEKIGHVNIETIKNGEDSLRLIEEAEKNLRSLQASLPKIRQAEVAETVEGLTMTGQKIIDYLTEHPDKISAAHRFADYYLNMAEKLAGRYIDLEKDALPGSSAEEVKKKTGDALMTLKTAFDHQLSRLTEGEMMEIETDIKVLKETMKMEGDL